MILTDTYRLMRASEFANPKSEADILPSPYGDSTVPDAGSGVWPCSCIDTVNFYYAIASYAVLSVADGNSFSVYVDGVLQSSGYTVYPSGTVEGKTLAYIDFTSDPEKEVTVRCKGKNSGSSLIENPIDIIEDILTDAGFSGSIDQTALALAKQRAEAQSYVAAGVLLQDRTLQDILNEILASFLGDAWLDHDGNLIITFDTTGQNKYNVLGHIAERDLQDPKASRSLDNCCNQAEVYYAPNYTQVDRRFKEGVKSGNYDGYDDGSSTKDTLSQARFGEQPKTFEFNWIRKASVVSSIQSRLVEKFATPPWLFTATEQSYRNLYSQKGQYVGFSWEGLYDSDELPLRNEIGRLLEMDKQLDSAKIGVQLMDCDVFISQTPWIADGSHLADGTGKAGYVREREVLV